MSPRLLSLLLVATSCVQADGPFTHTSDGVTQPILIWQGPPGQDGSIITYAECTPGSRCANRTQSVSLHASATQYSTFMLRTGASLGGDHFAFGVRGNAANAVCGSQSIVKSNPLLGRGIVIYPNQRQIKFENFSTHCYDGSGVAESTTRSISQFITNNAYLITIWASATNTGYAIEREFWNRADQRWDYQEIASGDCLAQASAADQFRCAKHPQDLPSANRTFIANTQDLNWRIFSWHIGYAP